MSRERSSAARTAGGLSSGHWPYSSPRRLRCSGTCCMLTLHRSRHRARPGGVQPCRCAILSSVLAIDCACGGPVFGLRCYLPLWLRPEGSQACNTGPLQRRKPVPSMPYGSGPRHIYTLQKRAPAANACTRTRKKKEKKNHHHTR